MTTATKTKTMTTTEVASKLVELCRDGKYTEAVNELYDDNVLSLEPTGARNERTEGKDGKIAKDKGFFSMVEEMHSSEISDALVAENFFSVTMKMDMTVKGMGRMPMNELCVYEVKDGKIVLEQFFFTPMPM